MTFYPFDDIEMISPATAPVDHRGPGALAGLLRGRLESRRRAEGAAARSRRRDHDLLADAVLEGRQESERRCGGPLVTLEQRGGEPMGNNMNVKIGSKTYTATL